jgi:hypothetical protein
MAAFDAECRRWLVMSAAAMSASISAGRPAAVAASTPWRTDLSRTLVIQTRLPVRSSPAAFHTAASRPSSEHAQATRSADAASQVDHPSGSVGGVAIFAGSWVGSGTRRSVRPPPS